MAVISVLFLGNLATVASLLSLGLGFGWMSLASIWLGAGSVLLLLLARFTLGPFGGARAGRGVA